MAVKERLIAPVIHRADSKNLKEIAKNLDEISILARDRKLSLEKVIQGFKRKDGSGFAYLDSNRIGGVIFEMIERPAQNSKTA